MLNGYRTVYHPTHPRAMNGSGYDGYVYEHILIAEEFMERQLHEDEVVHHLNEIRDDNSPDNLIVMINSQHSKLHSYTSGNTNKRECKRCTVCLKPLSGQQFVVCSRKCSGISKRSKGYPTKDQLSEDLSLMRNFSAIGRKYGVSDNTIRKWAKVYGLTKKL